MGAICGNWLGASLGVAAIDADLLAQLACRHVSPASPLVMVNAAGDYGLTDLGAELKIAMQPLLNWSRAWEAALADDHSQVLPATTSGSRADGTGGDSIARRGGNERASRSQGSFGE